MDGKGFAYLGIPPLFIGELTTGLGVFVLLRMRGWAKLWEMPQILALSAFILLGIARTIPFVDQYGIDSIRDSCLYYYGAFAFVVAALLIAEPTRLVTLLDYYRRFAKLFLIVILVVFTLYHFAAGLMPSWPWGEGVSLISEKEGDVLVHLGGIVAFWMSGLAGPVPAKWSLFLALDAAVMGAIDRAGMVSFGSAMALGMAQNPRGTMGWRMLGALAAGVVLLAVTGISVEVPNGKGRELSFAQIVSNVRSTFGDVGTDGLDSTKEWRTNWWKDIVHDTVGGKHFWTGQGFGINLADEYGYQVGDRTLRSPHNAHMTILARMGVPGLVAWIVVLGAWALMILDAWYRARRAGEAQWAGLFLFLGAFWLAFLINASFDVFLEGPMGGIWFWAVYGAGVGALWIYKNHPEILSDDGPESFPVGSASADAFSGTAQSHPGFDSTARTQPRPPRRTLHRKGNRVFDRRFIQTTESRSNNLDLLRFLLACVVIHSHSFMLTGHDYGTLREKLVHLQLGGGGFAVDFFFMLSGFLVANSWLRSRGLGDFLKKRTLRIYPGFIVCLAFCVFVVGPLGGPNLTSYFSNSETWSFFRPLVLGPLGTLPGVYADAPWAGVVNVPLWTIRFEFLCYLFLAGLGMAGLLRHRTIILAMFILAAATFAVQTSGLSEPARRCWFRCSGPSSNSPAS